MRHAIALRGPTCGELRLRAIGEHGEGGVGLRPSGASVGPFFGECVPGSLDTAFGLGQLRQRIRDVFQLWRGSILDLQWFAPALRQDAGGLPASREFAADGATQLFEFRDGGIIFPRSIHGTGRPARGHEDRAERVVVPLRNSLQFVIVTTGAGDGGGKEDLGESINFVVHHFLMDAVRIETAAVAVLAEMVKHRADEALVDL